MIRLFVFVIQIAVLAALALWLADKPGTARIVWHGTVIETSAAFLGLCVLIFAYALHLLWRLWHFLRHGPVHWKLRRRIGKLQQGHDALARGLVAVASGNATEAGKLAVAARKNAAHPALALWLQAQAAQLAGDAQSARSLFRALASDADAAVLGYRGLIADAKKAGKWDEVDRLIDECRRAKPATPWLNLIRMESAARRGQWGEAEQALTQASAARLLDPAAGRQTRAALRIAVSREALATGNKDAALRAAEQAAQQAPHWLPAQINLAETLAATDNARAARRAIERAWKEMPHPQLADILRGLAQDRLDAYKQTEHLCRSRENSLESRMALALAALDADIWGEARRHLTACVNDGTATRGVYQLLARLERRERGDDRAAAAWMIKSADAAPDSVWSCRSCGGAHKIWQPVCVHCGAFDSVEWRQPGQGKSAALLTGGHDD
ncbi:MAG: hypothetical protein KGI37_03270 [Alphaproteobacteria bacterium]|nr:hypothetical protein [Alphaproteobacteria bacterium]